MKAYFLCWKKENWIFLIKIQEISKCYNFSKKETSWISNLFLFKFLRRILKTKFSWQNMCLDTLLRTIDKKCIKIMQGVFETLLHLNTKFYLYFAYFLCVSLNVLVSFLIPKEN
jgi:hypothetical protein